MARKSLLDEYRRGFAARSAARGRLPAWLALAMPVVGMASIAAITALLIWAGLALHHQFGAAVPSPESTSFALVFIGSMATAVIPGMMLGNVLLWLVPPAQRPLNNFADGSGSSFRRNMMALAKGCCVSVPVGAILLAIGIFFVE